MANIDITNINTRHVVIDGLSYEDGLLTFAGADEFPRGTLLARHTGTKKFIPYVKGGSSNGNGVPRAVVTDELLSKAGAGDLGVRVLVTGTVNKKALIIDADGDGENIDGNVLDLLRQTGLVPEDLEQNSRHDNPQPAGGDS